MSTSGARVVLIAVLTASLVVPLLALAHRVDVEDGQDVPGPLDVRRIEKRGDDKVRFRIVTHASWKSRRLWDRGYVTVHFDTHDDADHFERYALVRFNGSKLTATLWRDRERKSDFKVAQLPISRSSRHDIRFRLALWRLKLPDARTTYSWYAVTLLTNERCPRVCLDRVPDSGTVLEPVPGAEPSISPTVPTISPTPSLTSSPTPSAF